MIPHRYPMLMVDRVIDMQLDEMGLTRNIAARCAHFSLIPDMVASSLLVLTSGRQF